MERVIAIAVMIATAAVWAGSSRRPHRETRSPTSAREQRLRHVNQSFEQNIRQLHSQLAAYEERTRKLAIVAGRGATTAATPASAARRSPRGHDAASNGTAATRPHRAPPAGNGEGPRSRRGSLANRFRWLSAMPTVTPTGGLFTSGFGLRRDPVNGRPAFHAGIDIAAPPGRAVHTTADGVVVLAGPHGDLGNAVVVSHGFGLTTRYGHLSATAVQPGQRRRWDSSATSAQRALDGYHLHYGLLKDGEAVNRSLHPRPSAG